jgi:hypothetical protein
MRCGAGQFRAWPGWKFRANHRHYGSYISVTAELATRYGGGEIEVLLRFLNILMKSSLGLSDIEQPESKSVITSDSSGKTTFSLQDVS